MDIGKVNKKITFELNEYERFYEKLKSDYKESLTKEIIRNKLDQYFKFAQTVKALTYSDYFDIYIEQKKKVNQSKRTPYKNIQESILLF